MSARDVFEAYLTRINLHDFSLVASLISDDCTFWFSSGTYSGLAETRGAFEKTWRLIVDEIYKVTDTSWVAESESAAVCVYTFHWEGFIGGQKKSGSGRGTSCFRKEAGGWKIIHEHLSSFPLSSKA